MKKIIATVLAMVMALALCTTAFADTTFKVGDYAKVGEVTASNSVAGHPAYYVKVTEEHTAATVDTAKTDGEVYLKSGDGYKMADEVTATKYTQGYYTVNVALYANAKAASCSDDGYKVALYQDAAGAYYAKMADVDAYNTANPTSKITATTVKVFLGAKFDDAVAYYKLTKDDVKSAGGHALYKTSEVWGKNDVTVYACAVCGGKYVIKSDVNANDAVESLAKISYGPVTAGDVKSVLNSKGIDVTKAYEPSGSVVMYTLSAGTTTPSTGTTTKPSPKTFDAGIAMYVGMALTSVAGSAVIIGKKKEF